ncbi:MAG: tetratricopeptide repeat protein [Pseudomonadota bacterium]
MNLFSKMANPTSYLSNVANVARESLINTAGKFCTQTIVSVGELNANLGYAGMEQLAMMGTFGLLTNSLFSSPTLMVGMKGKKPVNTRNILNKIYRAYIKGDWQVVVNLYEKKFDLWSMNSMGNWPGLANSFQSWRKYCVSLFKLYKVDDLKSIEKAYDAFVKASEVVDEVIGRMKQLQKVGHFPPHMSDMKMLIHEELFEEEKEAKDFFSMAIFLGVHAWDSLEDKKEERKKWAIEMLDKCKILKMHEDPVYSEGVESQETHLLRDDPSERIDIQLRCNLHSMKPYLDPYNDDVAQLALQIKDMSYEQLNSTDPNAMIQVLKAISGGIDNLRNDAKKNIPTAIISYFAFIDIIVRSIQTLIDANKHDEHIELVLRMLKWVENSKDIAAIASNSEYLAYAPDIRALAYSYLLHGRILLSQNDRRGARRKFDTSIKMGVSPEIEGVLTIGELLGIAIEEGDCLEQKRCMVRGMELIDSLNPKSHHLVFANYSNYLKEKGRFMEAISAMSKADELEPGRDDYRGELSILAAREIFETEGKISGDVLRLVERDHNLLHHLIYHLFEAGRFSKIVDITERAADVCADLQLWKARSLLELGKFTESQALFGELLNNYGDEPDYWKGLGDINYRQKRFDIAVERYERALKLDPHNSNLAGLVADSHQDNGNKELAGLYYMLSFSFGGDGAEHSAFSLGRIFEEKGDVAGALRLYGWADELGYNPVLVNAAQNRLRKKTGENPQRDSESSQLPVDIKKRRKKESAPSEADIFSPDAVSSDFGLLRFEFYIMNEKHRDAVRGIIDELTDERGAALLDMTIETITSQLNKIGLSVERGTNHWHVKPVNGYGKGKMPLGLAVKHRYVDTVFLRRLVKLLEKLVTKFDAAE